MSVEKYIQVRNLLTGEVREIGLDEDEFYLIATEHTLPDLADNGNVERLADVLVEAIESIARRWSGAANVSSDVVKSKIYLRMLAKSESVIRRYDEYDDGEIWFGEPGVDVLE